MELTVLGSGTAVFRLDRFPAGYLVQAGGTKLLLDGGSGAARRLLQAGTQPEDLDGLCYTHLHPDHTGELVPLLFGFANPDSPRQKPLAIVGPANFPAFLDRLGEVYGDWISAKGLYERSLHPGEGKTEVGDILIEGVPVHHMEGSLAYRLTAEGKTLAYSGDTGLCGGIVAAGKGADLLVLECSFPDRLKITTHLTPRLCAQIARAANPKRLLLTHFYPQVEGEPIVEIVRQQYDGDIMLAKDLMRIQI